MTNTLRSLNPPLNTVPDGGPYAGRHRLANSTVVVQPRVSSALLRNGALCTHVPPRAGVPGLRRWLVGGVAALLYQTPLQLAERHFAAACCPAMPQGTFFVPCQYNQADCHKQLVVERALGIANLASLAGTFPGTRASRAAHACVLRMHCWRPVCRLG